MGEAFHITTDKEDVIRGELKMKITIVGAGNMGLAMTAYLARKQYNVTLYSSRDVEKLSLFEAEKNTLTEVKDYSITANPELAFSDADIIFCTYPAFLRKQFLEQNASRFKEEAMLGFVPGYGGIEYQCRALIERGVTVPAEGKHFFGVLQKRNEFCDFKKVYFEGRESYVPENYDTYL